MSFSVNPLLALGTLLSVVISSAHGDETKITTIHSQPTDRTLGDRRFSVEIRGQEIARRDLNETFTFYPAAGLLQKNNTDEWNREWKEKCACATMVYDMVNRNRLVIGPGIILGSSWGEFSAEDVDTPCIESWETHSAFLWGGLIRAELRASRLDGPFLQTQYSICTAEAKEEDETIYPVTRPGHAENRYARFRWQNDEFLLAVGWRRSLLSAMAGARHTSFELKKWLTFNMPESSSDPAAAILNQEGSRYHYAPPHPWSAFLALEFQARPEMAVIISSNITADQNYYASLKWNF